MKKLLFVFLALCLFAVPVMAQTADDPQVINWEDLEDDWNNFKFGGQFYHITDLGIQFLVPNGLNQIGLSDADIESGAYAAFFDETATLSEIIYLRDLGVDTLTEVAELASKNMAGFKFPGYFKLNGFDAIMIYSGETDELITVIPTDQPQLFIQLALKPISQSEDLNSVSGFIFGSLSPYSED